ncbi:hypothetical protein [Azospirillum sp.]|uniref:hypothetical protein n=1 Tax=Azospirillum sp. TaxID=34012 RepID=UPI00261959FA|nr:hypothetical protein [Azospirillum sp.]
MMEAIPIALSAVSTAVGVYGSVQQGQAQAEQQRYQQRQQQLREEQLRTQAMQDETARREELTANLNTIAAVRAGRGLSQTSPTALVIRDDTTNDAMDAMHTSRLNILNGAESARQAGIQAGNAADSAAAGGWIKGGVSLLDFGKGVAETGIKNGWFDGEDVYGRRLRETTSGRLTGGV